MPGAGAGAGAAEKFYSEPEPEPECFPGAGAGAGADQKCHGSASLQPTPVRRLETESSVVDALTKRVAELEARFSAVTVPAQRTTPARPDRVRGDTRAPVGCDVFLLWPYRSCP